MYSCRRMVNPLDGWTPSPSVLGQMDALGPWGPSVLGWMDYPLDGPPWRSEKARTLSVTPSIVTLAVTRTVGDAMLSIAVSNTPNHNSA